MAASHGLVNRSRMTFIAAACDIVASAGRRRGRRRAAAGRPAGSRSSSPSARLPRPAEVRGPGSVHEPDVGVVEVVDGPVPRRGPRARRRAGRTGSRAPEESIDSFFRSSVTNSSAPTMSACPVTIASGSTWYRVSEMSKSTPRMVASSAAFCASTPAHTPAQQLEAERWRARQSPRTARPPS